jgi:NADH:ubiquinone oxidoreductase subunit 3 (subunit A)
VRKVAKPFILFSAAAIVSAVLWAVTLAPAHFKHNTTFEAKEEAYECGFKNTYKMGLSTRVKVSGVLAFLALYEIEMFFFVPGLLNAPVSLPVSVPILVIVTLVIVLTCVLDKRLGTLEFFN